MVSISNTTSVVCLLLTIFLGVQLKYDVSGAPLFPTEVTVEMTNRLTNRNLALRCKDKNNDLGVHQINVFQTYSFSFFPKNFFSSTLYFCHFVWSEGNHYFDIYMQERDGYCDKNHKCSWDIIEAGPCKNTKASLDCFVWNKPVAAAGRRLLVQQNNSTLYV